MYRGTAGAREDEVEREAEREEAVEGATEEGGGGEADRGRGGEGVWPVEMHCISTSPASALESESKSGAV